jgi:hypothetical protein
MTAVTPSDTPAIAQASRAGNAAPVALLLVLAPVIGELLSGATRLSYIFVLVPQVMVWGCGALLIRELARRWHGGILTFVLLGLALAVAEEFVIQQTSLAPLPWLTTQIPYGRVLDVNWLYLLYMLGYETVWIVLVPILVVELLYPARRSMPWLAGRGLLVTGAVFVLGSFIAWYLWVVQARVHVFNAEPYHPPLAMLLVGCALVVLLILAAWALRRRRPAVPASAMAPSPFGVVAATVLLGLPWYVLITLVFVPTPAVPFWLWLGAGVAWAGLAWRVLVRWAHAAGWGPMHDWALAFGAMLVNMGGGYLGSNWWPPMDLYAKVVFNIVAVAGMIVLARHVIGRGPAAAA